jgi:heat shock protein HslJ
LTASGRWLVSTAKRLVSIVGAAAILLLLASCATPKDQGGPDPGLRGQWELLSAKDAGGTIPLANQLITLTIDGDTTTTGRSTCSDYRAHVYGTVSSIWVTATLPREQHCGIQVQLDIEQRYIDDLNQVRTGVVTGGVLDLLAPGIDLRYQRALALPLNLVVGHIWKLATVAPDSYYATANPTQVPETGATVRFDENGTLTGKTGCRTFTANYEENAGEIVTSHFADHAGGPCSETEQAADTHLLDVLDSGFTFLSGLGGLKISSPRAELALTFVD